MARGDASEMGGLLRRQLAVALAQGGWSPAAPASEPPFVLAEFLRPLSDGLVATAAVGRASSIPDRLPVLISHLHVGVGYEPLRRLWPLLGERYRLALVHEAVWPPEPEDEDEERWELKVSTVADAETAVAELAGVVLREAPSVVERYASIEQLLDEFGYGEQGGWVDQRAVALLATARRFEGARKALARYQPLTGYPEGDREARRFVHQITRYIDSGGDLALVPSKPPPSQYTSSPLPPVSEMWRQARAREQAVEAVRRMDPETDRGELRAALERELQARGLTKSPLWYEQTLDHLHISRVDKVEMLAKGVTAAARLGFKAIRALREHRPLPDLSVPVWLECPDRAAYRVSRRADAPWTAVQLDDLAKAWLDKAYGAIPRLVGLVAGVNAWLEWEEKLGDKLVVNVGEERVGTLDTAATEAYRQTMAAAAERDELPYAPARLTPRPTPDGYLLELQLPDQGAPT